MSINLLPEELRRPEPKPAAARPDIQFTNPSRSHFQEQRPEVVTKNPVVTQPWYQRWFGHTTATPQKIGQHTQSPVVLQAVPHQATHTQAQQPGRVPPAVVLPQHEHAPSAATPPQQHWWQRSTAVKPIRSPQEQTLPDRQSNTPSGMSQSPLHQPATSTAGLNGTGIAVDLLADRAEFFTPQEFYRRLLRGGLVLLAAAIVVGAAYLGLRWWQGTTSQEGLTVSQQISLLQQQLAGYQQERENIQEFDQRLAHLRAILDAHPFWSKLFIALESSTLPTVSYQSLTVDPNGGVRLSASAPDYTTVAQQVLAWQQQTESVSAVSFTTAALAEVTDDAGTVHEYVTFELLLQFKPEYFLTTPETYGLAR